MDESERFLKETNQDKGYMPNELFCSRFTDVWGKEVRNVAHVARTQLFVGEIVQKTCTVSEYTKQFRGTAYKVGDMQEADIILLHTRPLAGDQGHVCRRLFWQAMGVVGEVHRLCARV